MTIDPQQDLPPQKTQHETNALAGALPARAPPVCTSPARSGGQINSDVHASCWLTAKMNHSRKSLLCLCGLNRNEQKHQRRQTITQRDAARRLFWRLNSTALHLKSWRVYVYMYNTDFLPSLLLELYTTVLPAAFLVLVFCWYQICWAFGISVGIVPPLLVSFPPFFLKRGAELLKKGAIVPLLRKKGAITPFLIPNCTDRVFRLY